MRSLTATSIVRIVGGVALALVLGVTQAPLTPMAMAASSQRTGASSTSAAPCASPPAGFNPLAASDTQLLAYGLPTRPSASSAYFSQWVMAVTHAKKRGCEHHTAPSMEVAPHSRGGKGQLNTFGYNWSGWEDNNQTYYAASGQWTIPCINTSNSPSGSDIGDWVGLGGENNGNLLQTGTYWDVKARIWKSFYEEAGSGTYTPKGIDEFATETCGHNMFAEVDYGQTYVSQSYYFVEDVTIGAYWTNHNYFAPAFNSAEWIDEASDCAYGVWYKYAAYGNVYWSYAGAGLSYASEHPISYWPTVEYYAVSDTNYSVTTEYAESLNSAGNGFTDHYNNQNGGTTC